MGYFPLDSGPAAYSICIIKKPVKQNIYLRDPHAVPATVDNLQIFAIQTIVLATGLPFHWRSWLDIFFILRKLKNLGPYNFNQIVLFPSYRK